MTTKSAISQSIVRLRERDQANAARFIDMQLGLADLETGERLLTVGGVWDRVDKCYAGPAATEHVIHIQPAQLPAARWLCQWFTRYADARTRKDADEDPTLAWCDFERVYSVLFHGGRRGGKSHLSCVALAVFSIMMPGTVCWAVSPTEEKTEELRAALASLIPGAWYGYVKDERTFTLANWSQIVLRSGFKAENLKAGGVGMALYNEGQQMSESGYVQLRGATSDSGALTIVTANPPDKPIGRWVERFVEDVRARRRAARTFFFDWRENPFIEAESLEALAHETDEKTFAREILGEFVPIGDVVFHAWLDSATIRPAPVCLGDGADDQANPRGVIIHGRAPVLVIGEAMVEVSDEDGLVDALEEHGPGPRDCGRDPRLHGGDEQAPASDHPPGWRGPRGYMVARPVRGAACGRRPRGHVVLAPARARPGPLRVRSWSSTCNSVWPTTRRASGSSRWAGGPLVHAVPQPGRDRARDPHSARAAPRTVVHALRG